MDGLPPQQMIVVVQAAQETPSRVAAMPVREAQAIRRPRRAAAPVGEPDEDRYGPNGIYANVPPIDDEGRDQLTMFRAWNSDPIGNHDRNLAAIDQRLAAVVRRAQATNPGLRFVIGSGRRTEAEQAQAGRWGWSPRLNPFSRNVALRKHIDGLAVDLWALDGNGRVTFDPRLQGAVAGAMAQAARDLRVGILWGGAWRSARKDPPHFELVR